MASLDKLLAAGRFVIFADLGANSLELARMAEESGADVVITHVNSGLDDEPYTGPPELEIPIISEIAGALSIPVGLALGGRKIMTPTDMETIQTVNPICLIGMAHHLPAWLFSRSTIPVIIGVGAGYTLEQVEAIQELENVVGITLKLQSPGPVSPVSALDLSTVRILSRRLHKPLFLWSKTKTGEGMLEPLWKSGCRGILEPFSSSDSEESKHRIMSLREAAGRLTN
jgi:hypothetical protein